MTLPAPPVSSVSSYAMAPLLQASNLWAGFPDGKDGWLHALRGVSFELAEGEILGLVGESGSGKSLSSLALLGLLPKPGKLLQGEVFFKGQAITQLSEPNYRKLRGAELALIPQDPLSALNPVYTVGAQIVEVLQAHLGLSQLQAKQRTIELFNRVQLPNAAERFNQYPHEFSGGMRQRALIAMALSCQPSVLIADEPTTALDVTVQAQILNLLETLAKEEAMAVLFITHDLGVVAELCHRVAVMYAGQLVEEAPVEALFNNPKHPYTQGLLASVPSHQGLGVLGKRLACIAGQPPCLGQWPVGCAFAPRCGQCFEPCTQEMKVPLVQQAPGHWSLCYLQA